MELEKKLSKVSRKIKSSLIRELLDLKDPEMISFGGGVPDPDTFPRHELAKIASEVIENEHRTTLQYGSTGGDNILKEQYIKLLKKHENIDNLDVDNLLVTVGSQQALYLLGITFLDEESYCGVSRPIYLGAASAFQQREPNFINVPLLEDGMDLDYLESELERLNKEGNIEKFKFLYVISNFHNPAGVTMGIEKRKRVVELANKYDFIIVEDDPYGALRFEGEKLPSIYSMAPERTILLNTFSKVLSPGLRLGLIVGPKDMVRRVSMAKQAADLCTPALTQRIGARYLERFDLIDGIQPTIEIYREKKNLMMKLVEEKLGDIKGIKWINPEGGLFTWITLPEGFDTLEMFEVAKEEKILYIPGAAFYVDEPDNNTMRLSFCLPTKEKIVEGMDRLRKTIDRYAKEKGLEI